MLSAAYNYWEKLPPESRTSFRFHHISTDEVFGSLGPTGLFTEDTPYVPRLPYSASKAASDHLVSAWLLRAGDVSNKQVTDIAFGVEQRLADHALYGRDAGHDDPVPAHFIEQQSR